MENQTLEERKEQLQARVSKQFSLKTLEKKITMPGVFVAGMTDYNITGKSIGIFNPAWKNETVDQYMDIICNYIFPALPPNTPMDHFLPEDFDEILAKIQFDKQYSTRTMEQYELLIWRICQWGYQNNHCPDLLWGTRYYRGSEKKQNELEDKRNQFLRIRKSLTDEEEQLIAKKLFHGHETSTGEALGLLLMFCCGLRNNEACGLSYGDLRSLFEYPNTWVLWIYQSTKENSNDVQAGGKTKNANRVLPILECLLAFLQKRITFLQEQIKIGNLPPETNVMELPIVCRGTQYEKRCKTGDLSMAGRLLFKEIKMEQEQVRYLDELIQQNKLTDEKDCTTYLFRRNCGTHLKNLDLSMAQVQYYMGHDVEDDYVTRNSFTTESKLMEMKALLRYHPLDESNMPPNPTTLVDDMAIAPPQNQEHTFLLKPEEAGATYFLEVKSTIPTDSVSVNVESNKKFSGTIYKNCP